MNELLKSKIHTIRGKQVMLDSDLAQLYEISVKVLNQSVKRNIERFPPDFMFQLNQEEFDSLGSQFVTSKEQGLEPPDKGVLENRGGRTYLPYVFTEQGVYLSGS